MSKTNLSTEKDIRNSVLQWKSGKLSFYLDKRFSSKTMFSSEKEPL